jgi:SPP1 family predicted phage head-tail adaptor
MRAGDLRRRIDIQSRASTKDTFGQQVTTWSTLLAAVPAQIEALQGRELVAAQAMNSEITHQITVRYHPLLADHRKVAGMRAIYVNAGVIRIMELLAGINVDERNRAIQIPCREGLTEG